MIYKASDLSSEQRMALESLLGRALSDREAVSIRAFEPPPLSGEQRQEILAGLDAYFARIDAQRMSVSPGSSFLSNVAGQGVWSWLLINRL